MPLAQNHAAPLTLIVRSAAPARDVEASLRSELRALDPTLPLYGVKTIDEFLERALGGARALALTVSSFAVLALLLATVGIYGLMSFTVSQKRYELGIRMALGASRRDVLALFLGQAARIVIAGVAIGLVMAWVSSRALSSLLYGVGAGNPAVYALVALVLVIVALTGSYVPSRPAAKLDPNVTLRHE